MVEPIYQGSCSLLASLQPHWVVTLEWRKRDHDSPARKQFYAILTTLEAGSHNSDLNRLVVIRQHLLA